MSDEHPFLCFVPSLVDMGSRAALYEKLKDLPDAPGVYRFLDGEGRILYVGKAKSLRKRVANYFQKEGDHRGRTALLVKRIEDLSYILVDTEYEALLLENSLIKKYQPRYNVMLKDDKTYPWICIKNERFPRVFPTRNPVQDGSEYYGPYASVRMMRTLLDLLRQLYPLRTCHYDLSEEKVQAGKYRECLEYHIGKCKAPCVGKQSEADYNESIRQVRDIIRGNVQKVLRVLKEQMEEASRDLDFEKAALLKEKIDDLENYRARSTVVSPRIHNVDVISIVPDEKRAFFNYLRVSNGAIIQSHTMELKNKYGESDAKLLEMAHTEMRQRYESAAKEVIVPFEPESSIEGIHFKVPQKGDKKKLLDLSYRNARHYQLEQHRQDEKKDPSKRIDRKLEKLQEDLKLPERPDHIECFDNSNTQGEEPVSACVVFRRAKPSKKEYRSFNIQSVDGPDDTASMEEAVQRRYRRLLDEGEELPQLLVIDGGKGQLGAAKKSLERLGLEDRISLIGIAKRLEEIHRADDPVPLYLDKRSESLKLIQHLRDEAHRFGIEHHRKRRKKRSLHSELTEIEGVGEKTAQKLIEAFRSVKRVKEADQEALEAVVPSRTAKKIHAHFKEEAQ
jgi:excinuclease ABC subunit C